MTIDNTVTRAHVEQVIHQLVGLKCWDVSYVGTTIGLSFGEKRPRKRPIPKAKPDSIFGHYEGEVTLMLWCPWRVRLGQDVIISSIESPDERIHAEESRLMTHPVRAVGLDLFAWDLQLSFENQVVLESFCSLDATTNPKKKCDISLRHNGRRLVLGPGSRCEESPWDH